MKSKWARVPLGEIAADTQYGTSQRANENSRGLPILRMNNITRTGQLDLSDLKHIELPPSDLERYTVRAGDLLFNRTNSPELVGKMAVWDRVEQFALAGYLVRVRLRPEKADPKFVALWFNTPEMKAELRSHAKPSINMSNISASELLKFHVPLPPLDEQRRIADVLDRAEAVRAKRRAALAELEFLPRSVFYELCGDPATNPHRWPTVRLAELVRNDDTINYGVVQPGDDLEEGIPLIRVGDLCDGHVSHAALKQIAPSVEANYKRSRLQGDEILVSCVGTIGIIALADESVKGFNIARAVARIRLSEKVNRIYIANYLQTDFVQRYFTKELRTVSQPTLNIKQLAETEVRIPSSKIQYEFARRISTIEKLKSSHRASLAELDSLFSSLQHRAFRGEL